MRVSGILLALGLTATSASAAMIEVFDTRSAFNAEVDDTVLVTDFNGGNTASPLFGTPAIEGTFRLNNDRLQRVSGRNGRREAQSTTLNFSRDLRAVSFTIGSFGVGEEATLTLSNGASTVITGAANGFFGLTSDRAFSSLAFADSGPGAQFNIDNLRVALAPVPGPASLPMLFGAVGLIGWIARRKRAA